MDELRPVMPLSGLERERALFLYRSALERGDADTVNHVLQLAETDVALQTLILESHALDMEEADAEIAEAQDASSGWNVAEIRATLERHLSADDSAVPASFDPVPAPAPGELPTLTLAEVAARMQADSASLPAPNPLEGSAAEFAHLTQRLGQLQVPLPSQLDARAVSQLFQNLGLAASEQFQAEFREMAQRLRQNRT